jgi:hypothetical protein
MLANTPSQSAMKPIDIQNAPEQPMIAENNPTTFHLSMRTGLLFNFLPTAVFLTAR